MLTQRLNFSSKKTNLALKLYYGNLRILYLIKYYSITFRRLYILYLFYCLFVQSVPVSFKKTTVLILLNIEINKSQGISICISFIEQNLRLKLQCILSQRVRSLVFNKDENEQESEKYFKVSFFRSFPSITKTSISKNAKKMKTKFIENQYLISHLRFHSSYVGDISTDNLFWLLMLFWLRK